MSDGDDSSGGGKILSWLLVILLVGGGFWWRSKQKSDLGDETLGTMREFVAQMDNYEANSEYINGLLETSHQSAFESSYTSGGRRRRAKFDEGVYIVGVLNLMSETAERDGRQDVSASIGELRTGIFEAMAETADDSDDD